MRCKSKVMNFKIGLLLLELLSFKCSKIETIDSFFDKYYNGKTFWNSIKHSNDASKMSWLSIRNITNSLVPLSSRKNTPLVILGKGASVRTVESAISKLITWCIRGNSINIHVLMDLFKGFFHGCKTFLLRAGKIRANSY